MEWRPDVEFDVYLDDSGEVIPYGERWGWGSPADEAYSRSIHPERFEVAWTLARALVDHLVMEFDVDVVADADPAEGRTARERSGPARAAVEGAPPAVRRIVPRGPGAPLTVVETESPGVELLAGATLAARAPVCGCDACDECVEEMADALAEFAFAVAAGSIWERIERRGVAHHVGGPQGSSGGWGRLSRDERKEARRAIAAAPPFAPWPRRGSDRSRSRE